MIGHYKYLYSEGSIQAKEVATQNLGHSVNYRISRH